MESELSRPGYRQYIEKRADGSVWRVEERADNVHGLLMHQYYKAWKIAHDRGLPLPPVPPQGLENDNQVVCINRTERGWEYAGGKLMGGYSRQAKREWCSRSIHGANASLTRHFEGAAAQRMNRRMNSRSNG